MSATVTQTHTSQTLKLRAGDGSPVLPAPPTFSSPEIEREHIKRKLATAFRIFDKHGLNEGSAGHISVRDPIDPSCIWLNPYGRSFALMTPEDLLLVNSEGDVVPPEEGGGGKPGNGQVVSLAAVVIHTSIHAAAPDVHAAAHSHSLYGRAFAALGRNLEVPCEAREWTKLYDQFGGAVIDPEEGKLLAECLGKDHNGLVLRNHGILSAGQTVEATVGAFIELEKACKFQLEIDAAHGKDGIGSKGRGDRQLSRQEREAHLWRLGNTHFEEIEREIAKRA